MNEAPHSWWGTPRKRNALEEEWGNYYDLFERIRYCAEGLRTDPRFVSAYNETRKAWKS